MERKAMRAAGWMFFAAVLLSAFVANWPSRIEGHGNDSKAVATKPDDSKRSPKWPALRTKFLKAHPSCEACGERDKKKLNVHHVIPFHVDPAKELDETNLIVLCEGDGVNCHLLFGHLKNWKSYNVNVRKDAAEWRKKIEGRP